MEFTEVVAGRESIRKYDGRKPSEEQLAQILEEVLLMLECMLITSPMKI